MGKEKEKEKINILEETNMEEVKEIIKEEVKAPSEGELNRGQMSFKQQLEKEEYVDILIPATQLYPEGSNMPICLNGVTYTVPVGISFEKGVPKSIFSVWKDSFDADREVRMKMKKNLTGVIKID